VKLTVRQRWEWSFHVEDDGKHERVRGSARSKVEAQQRADKALAERGLGCDLRVTVRAGRWSWQFPVTRAGKRVLVTGTERTRKEAQQVATAAAAEYDRGRPLPADKQATVTKYLDETWLPAVRSDLRESTWSGYKNLLDVRVKPHLGHKRIVDLNGADIEALKADLLDSGGRDGRGLSPQSVRNTLRTLHKALDDAERWGFVDRNPVRGVRAPKVRRTEMRTWDGPQALQFLDATADDACAGGYLLALTAGLRRGECLGARWDDVNFDRGTLAVRRSVVAAGYKVHHNDTKTGRTRTIKLMAPTVTRLRQFRRRQLERHLALGLPRPTRIVTREDGGELHPQSLSYLFAKAVREVGLPTIRLHDCRHTCATVLLDSGASIKAVQEMLGHSSIQVTLDIYGHVTENMQETTAALGAAAIFGPSA
jgi:integrase